MWSMWVDGDVGEYTHWSTDFTLQARTDATADVTVSFGRVMRSGTRDSVNITCACSCEIHLRRRDSTRAALCRLDARGSTRDGVDRYHNLSSLSSYTYSVTTNSPMRI
jgi:hypothetical protein